MLETTFCRNFRNMHFGFTTLHKNDKNNDCNFVFCVL